jgi:hypothetical protein
MPFFQLLLNVLQVFVAMFNAFMTLPSEWKALIIIAVLANLLGFKR